MTLHRSGWLMQHKYTTFEYMIRVFFALTLASTGIGQNSSMAADQGKAQVCCVCRYSYYLNVS